MVLVQHLIKGTLGVRTLSNPDIALKNTRTVTADGIEGTITLSHPQNNTSTAQAYTALVPYSPEHNPVTTSSNYAWKQTH